MPSIHRFSQDSFNASSCSTNYLKKENSLHEDGHPEKIAAAVISTFNRLLEKADAASSEHSYKKESGTKEQQFLTVLSRYLELNLPALNLPNNNKISGLIEEIMTHLLENNFDQQDCLQTLHEIEHIIDAAGNIRKVSPLNFDRIISQSLSRKSDG